MQTLSLAPLYLRYLNARPRVSLLTTDKEVLGSDGEGSTSCYIINQLARDELLSAGNNGWCCPKVTAATRRCGRFVPSVHKASLDGQVHMMLVACNEKVKPLTISAETRTCRARRMVVLLLWNRCHSRYDWLVQVCPALVSRRPCCSLWHHINLYILA